MNRIEIILKAFAKDLQRLYTSKLPSASGNLVNSVTSIINKNGNEYEVIFSLLDYWKVVEEGRKAGKFPPPEAIKKWIRVIPVFPRPYTLPTGRQVIPTENQLAFLIGRKIATEGMQARPYLQESINELAGQLVHDLAGSISNNFRNSLTVEFMGINGMVIGG